MSDFAMIINMTKAEFERDYTLRAPAPGEYRDDLREAAPPQTKQR